MTAITPASVRELSSGQQLELLVNAISEYAIYMLDPDGFVRTWSSGATRLKNYRAAEIVGHHFSVFFTAEDRARGVCDRFLTQARKARCKTEGWRVRKDGSRFWAKATLEPIRSEDGSLIGFAEIIQDITQRKAAEQALIESERRFRLLVEGVTDYAIYMLDPSGVVANWNAGAERLKGYTSAEIIGQHFSRFYTREDRAAGLPARVLEAAAREGRYEAEGWRVRKDGGRFWASVAVDAIRDEGGELLGFAKITRDITERRAAQEALQESERELRLLVSAVTDYALYMLDPNGIVTNWNSGAQRIKGYAAEEIIGQHFSRFYTEHERSAGVPARALQTAAQEGRYEAEGWRVRRDGSLFWANAVIHPIKDEDGTLIGFAKITRDITERREAQLALAQAAAQRAHAQKMEALGQLTGGVAHDFNNLLMIIGGYMHTIKKLVGHDPKGMRAAEAIETAAQRGESLTRQLLTFSRRQTLNPVIVSLDERVQAFSAMVANTIAPARLGSNILPDTWRVKVDVNELELALVNIVLNARDAMSNAGLITLTAENVRLQPGEGPGDLEGDFVALTVADAGCGIPADILPRVFDPFFTTKQQNKGTGLGLSQVHGFAHQSGGSVRIESDLGKGTRLTLYLPRARAPAVGESRPTAIDPLAGGIALLVEDNPEVADVSVSMLEQLGYQVRTAANAEKALEASEQQRFDLIVSDIRMAGVMDGLALARAIRKRDPLLPVLLVTGYSEAASMADTEFTVLRKPYQLADLSRAIVSCLAGVQSQPSNLVHLRDARRSAQATKTQS